MCPESHPEVAFSRPWYGVDIGCDCLGIRQEYSRYELFDNANRVKSGVTCTFNQTDAGCRRVEPHHAIHMKQFSGVRVCGASIDDNFLTVVRPNLDGQCPESYAACDPTASPDNIYCLIEQDPSGRPLEERCPIVDIAIVRSEDYPNWV